VKFTKKTYIAAAILLSLNLVFGSAPLPPVLTTPVKGAVNQSTSPFISWNAVSFADIYRLQISTDSLFSLTVFDDSTIVGVSGQGIQTKQATGLTNNTKYFWRVSAKNIEGWGNYSAVWNFKTTTSIPPAPVLLSPVDASINVSTSPTLNWNAVAGATSYRLQISNDPSFSVLIVDTLLSGTSRSLSNLVNSTTYYWRVSSSNVAGNGVNSTEWSFMTIISSPILVAPITNSLNVSTSVLLQWKAVPFAARYHVQVSTDSLFVESIFYDSDVLQVYGNDTQSVSPGELTNATKYFWRINAQNETSTSSYSVRSLFTTIVSPPSAPTLVSPVNGIVQQPTTTTFTWNPVFNASSYRLQVSTDSTFSNLICNDSTVTTASKQLTILSANKQYFWRVNAKNIAATSGYSPVWSIKTIVSTPAISSPGNSSTNIPVAGTIKWNAVEGATLYQLQVSQLSSFSILVLNDSTIIDTVKIFSGLQNNVKYYLRVRALSIDGWGQYSATSNFTTIVTIPSVPLLQTPLDREFNQSIAPTLMWSLVSGATNYRVQVSTDTLFASLVVNDSALAVSSKAVSSLKNFQKYYWKVNAKNAAGWSNFTVRREFTTIVAIPKTIAPVNNAVNQPLQTSFSWSSVAGAVKYQLQISTTNAFDAFVYSDSTITDTVATVSNLPSSTKYYWRVAALSTYGAGGFSASSAFTTVVIVPAIPSIIAPLNGTADVLQPASFQWSASNGAASYRLQVSTDSLFANLVCNDSTITVANKTLLNLQNVTKYFWRVSAKNSAGSGGFCPTAYFSTGISKPNPIMPVLNALNQTTTPQLKWSSTLKATKYHLQVSTAPLFGSFVMNDSTLADTVVTLGGLENNTIYFWRVGARYSSGSSGFSQVFSFTTINPPPPVPVPLMPAGSATEVAQPMTMSWQVSLSATYYRLQIAADTAFSNIVFDDSTLTTVTKQISTLLPNLSYYWRVAAKNNGGWSEYFRYRSFALALTKPIDPKPVAPVHLQSQLPTTVQFRWNASPGTEYYRLQVSYDTLFSALVINDSLVTTTSSSAGLPYTNTVYFWRINARNIKGTSDYSARQQFTTEMGAPDQIMPIHNAISQSTTPVVRWRAVNGSLLYHLQLARDTGFTQLVFNDSTLMLTSWQFSGLQNTSTYHWRVKALSSTNQSPFSVPWSFSTIAIQPETPTLLSPQSGLNNVATILLLKWNSVSGATNYRVQVSTDTPFKTVVYDDSTLIDTVKSIGPLQNNTTYYWRISARNSSGSKGFSDVWSFRTALQIPATPIQALPISASIDQSVPISLRWNSVQNASSYRLQVSTDSPFGTVVYEDSTIADTVRQIGSLEFGKRYFWRVQAINAAGSSPYSNVWNFFTRIDAPVIPILSTPQNAANQSPQKIIFRWKKDTIASSYRLQLSTQSPFTTKIVDDSTLIDTMYQLTNLQENTQYFWRVSAKNMSGSSPFGEVWSFLTTENTPGIPNLRFPLSASEKQLLTVNLQWSAAQGAKNYHVQLALDSPFGTTVFEDSTYADTSITIPRLNNLTKYFWRVRAKNNSGYGSFSTIWSFTTIILPPQMPMLVSPNNASGAEPVSVVLKWRSIVSAKAYHVQVSDDTPFNVMMFEDSTSTDTLLAISPLRLGTKYYWRVRAINDGGKSPFTEIWNFKTATALGVQRENGNIPTAFALLQNYPNPFNPLTTISFAVKEESEVLVVVYDVLGRIVTTLVNENLSAGNYRAQWNGNRYSSGVYLYRIVARQKSGATFTQLKKMLLVK
jgi:hypothetical protein